MLISFIVPYQSIEMSVQIKIITDNGIEKIMYCNRCSDERDIFRGKERCRLRYKSFMKSLNLTFEDDLVFLSFKYFKSNFMQIHKGVYNLIPIST